MRLLLLLLVPSLAAAATGVVQADGNAPDDAALAAAAADASLTDVSPIALTTAGWITTGAAFAPCAGEPGESLADAVAEGRGMVEELNSAKAIARLDAALDAAPCSSTPTTRPNLLAALELLGQAAQDEGRTDIARRAYAQLLGADPGYRLTTPPGTGYDDLFDEVRREANAVRPASVAIQHADAAAVTWNGESIPASAALTTPAAPGRHLLQWWEQGTPRGAWVEVSGDAALVSAPSGPGWLLAEGPSDAAKQLALTLWLGSVAKDAGLDGIAVVQEAGGYVVGDGINTWIPSVAAAVGSAPPRATAPKGTELRLTLGGGYSTVQGFHYGEAVGALDLRLVGPLHVRVEGGAGFSPVDVGDEALGTTVVLPGVGAGVALRPPAGPVQPFGALTAGVFITPDSDKTAAAEDAARSNGDVETVARLDVRGPVAFRGYVDGGVDLLPGDGPLVIRVSGGFGFGLGFLARAGAQVGFRL
jgi:hypothetical protein